MNITDESPRSMDLDMRFILKHFLADMNLLVPNDRHIIVRILNQLYPMMEPIEKDFYEKKTHQDTDP